MKSEEELKNIAEELVAKDICSLLPEQLSDRVLLIRREILPSVIGSADRPNGFAWEFENGDEIRIKLEVLASLEGDCCNGGLMFQVQEDADAGRLYFEIVGDEAGIFRSLRLED